MRGFMSINFVMSMQVRKPRKKRRRKSASDPTIVELPGIEQNNVGINSAIGPVDSQPTPLLTQVTRPVALRNSQRLNSTSASNEYVAPVKIEPTGAFKASTWLPGFNPFPTPTCTCIPDMEERVAPGPTESDEVLLSIYRTRLSPQFPFVVIPQDVAAAELQRSRPCLAKAIQVVASLRSRRSMWNQSRDLLRHISESAFLGPDRSLDLLQGILVFLGFYHHFCFAHGQFNNLSHLASSMIADMRLDKPRTRPQLRRKGPLGIEPDEPKAMTHDERRAILAVWYIHSSYAVSFKQVNSPGRLFTQHMERQYQELQEANACETDQILLQLVCAQRINEVIAQLQQSEQAVDVRPSSNVCVANIDKLLAELQVLRGRGNQPNQQSYTVTSHYNLALMQLLEPQLVEADNLRNREAVAALRNTPDYFRSASVGGQEAADIALKACFEEWLSIPVCHLFYMPMSSFLQFTSGIVILLRRARLKLLNRYRLGDSNSAESIVNPNNVLANGHVTNGSDDLMLDYLSRLASQFERARIEMAAAHCSEWSNDILDLSSWKLRERKGCMEKWAKIIDRDTQSSATLATDGAGVQQSHRHSDFVYGSEGLSNPFQGMEEPSFWLDPLEALLLGGEDPHESWL
ncbi:Winged helix-turn-helix transcription repressor DNA-binding protein [Sarocladium implicatum]|nr:Winged helix-turn-helix transcription repressor DNA-binding protein [Sarocladium implicatum]